MQLVQAAMLLPHQVEPGVQLLQEQVALAAMAITATSPSVAMAVAVAPAVPPATRPVASVLMVAPVATAATAVVPVVLAAALRFVRGFGRQSADPHS